MRGDTQHSNLKASGLVLMLILQYELLNALHMEYGIDLVLLVAFDPSSREGLVSCSMHDLNMEIWYFMSAIDQRIIIPYKPYYLYVNSRVLLVFVAKPCVFS